MTIEQKLKLILLWQLCGIAGVIALLWMFCAICAGSGRAKRIAVGFDQTGNAALGGDEDETISARCWRYRADRKYSRLVQIIDYLFDDPKHCEDSFIDEQQRRQRYGTA